MDVGGELSTESFPLIGVKGVPSLGIGMVPFSFRPRRRRHGRFRSPVERPTLHGTVFKGTRGISHENS